MSPFPAPSDWFRLADGPGLQRAWGWGWKVTLFQQDFQSYLVALNGREKGAVYAAVYWGQSFRLIPGRTGEQSSDYVANRYAVSVTTVSDDFKRILREPLPPEIPRYYPGV